MSALLIVSPVNYSLITAPLLLLLLATKGKESDAAPHRSAKERVKKLKGSPRIY